MRSIATVVFVRWLCQGPRAHSQDARDLPHAFPREGATLVLDNDWGTVWDVTWSPGSSTAIIAMRSKTLA